MTLAIKASGLAKAYGDVIALNGIDIEVEQGTVLGLLGPNGSGKTTTVRILATLLQADSGSASVGGFDVATQPDEVRSVIGLTGQYAAVDEYLTGRENLELFGRLFHLSKFDAAKRATELLDRFDLSDAADRGIKGYSGGMRRRLDLAASLIGRPNVLFLDEPTTGLDPRSRQGMWAVIEDLISEGTTVLLTTQYLEEADQLANRIVVLDHDRIEIVCESAQDVARAASLIQEFGSAPATSEEVVKTVLLPVAGGSTAIVNIVRKLDENKIAIADIALRRPTLDDVFLSLTGHATEADEAISAPAKGRRGRKARS
ncbi:MAG: ATP-binding cassette domain-containing protein [Actinobacteria bacterium]|nr:ATP-binding cassette domain-containing protein [Actinomycetota bacterium]